MFWLLKIILVLSAGFCLYMYLCLFLQLSLANCIIASVVFCMSVSVSSCLGVVYFDGQ